MRLSQEPRPALEQALNPKLIEFYELLRLPSIELEQSIVAEIETNPALELSSDRLCPVCSSPMTDDGCRECGYRRTDSDTPDEPPMFSSDTRLADAAGWTATHAEFDSDPMSRYESPLSLQEQLKSDYRAAAPEDEIEFGEILIDCLDEDGYLDAEFSTLAEGMGVSEKTLERILRRIQQLDPPGVCARDLRECLSIQINRLSRSDSFGDRDLLRLAFRLVRDYWHLFSHHRYSELAAKLHIDVGRVQTVGDFVRTNLNPYPGRAFRPGWQSQSNSNSTWASPDVVIRKVDSEDEVQFTVDIPSKKSGGIRISRSYRELWDEMRKQPWKFPESDRLHVQKQITRAREFIGNLDQRRRTLKVIMEKIVAEQRAFLEEGMESLKPLTRLKVAEALGFHESTIGRAVSGKVVLLHSGVSMMCEQFFDHSLSVKEMMKDLLTREDPLHPLSDEKIASLLSERGLQIARRTIAKYREAIRIPAASKRRRYESVSK